MFDLLEPVYCILLWILFIIILLLLPFNKKIKTVLILLYILYSHKLIYLMLYITPGIKLLTGDIGYRKIFTNRIFNKFNIKKFEHNFHILPAHNTILVCNYPVSLFEYFIPHLLPKLTCLIAITSAEKAIKCGYTPEEYIIIDGKNKNNYQELKKKISEIIKTRSIFVYVENKSNRFHDFHVGKLRKGMFYIANELGITITPLAIDSVVISNITIPYQNFQIKVGPTENVSNPIRSIHKTKQFLIHNKNQFKINKFK